MDHNEAACGACRRIGELICCEGCVAAFHWRCAGYGELKGPGSGPGSSCSNGVQHIAPGPQLPAEDTYP